ncbi:putative reverse transcriptase domain-containing protein [Tanacetum coccineum]
MIFDLPRRSSQQQPSHSPAGIVQTTKLRKIADTWEGGEESVMSTQEYITNVIEDVGEDDNFRRASWVSVLGYVNVDRGIVTDCFGDVKKFLKNGKLEKVVVVSKSCTPNALGALTVTLKDLSGIIFGTIHYKVLTDERFSNAITVGAALIFHNVSIFSPKQSTHHYLNITKKNMVKVFHKDSGSAIRINALALSDRHPTYHETSSDQETATYGKIWDNEDIHDLRSIETEIPAIAFNDEVSSKTLSCEPTVSSLNDEIDFRISYDKSDDEDYTILFDQNSFSYKMISVNDLKTDSENDNDKVNMPSLSSPEPTVSCFDDLDFFNDLENEFLAIVYNDAQTSKLDDLDNFKDFENEFPAIVYNDAQTSKSDLSTKPILIPQHIDEFDLKSETSLFEYNEEEQNVLCFNDLFPFNIIYPCELKTDTDNDNDKVDIEHSSGNLSVKPLPDLINTNVGAYAHGK